MDKIYIALITGVFLWYLKACYDQATLQLLAATKLRAYLLHWKGVIIDNKCYFAYSVAKEWVADEDAKRNNLDEFGKLEELYKDKIKESIKKGFDDNGEDIIKDVHNILDKILLFEEKTEMKSVDFISSEVDKSSSQILDGKTFVSDSEAAVLGIYASAQAIALKMNILELLNLIKITIFQIKCVEKDLVDNEISNKINDFAIKGICTCKHIVRLEKLTDDVISLGKSGLTLKNFFDL